MQEHVAKNKMEGMMCGLVRCYNNNNMIWRLWFLYRFMETGSSFPGVTCVGPFGNGAAAHALICADEGQINTR